MYLPEHIRIAAHRGYSAAYPENTLPAIKAAIEGGILALEIDIQFSQDGVPILLHDDNFMQVAQLDKKVLEMSIAEIKRIAFSEKEKYQEKYSNVSCCTLFEFVRYLRQYPEVQVFVEIKPESIDYFGVAYVVKQLKKQLKSIWKQCQIISYSIPLLKQVRSQLQLPVGYILKVWDDESLNQAHALSPELVICNHTKIPKNTSFRESTWQWLLYEITTCDELFFYAQKGVQWVESKDPLKLLECLYECKKLA